MLIQTSDVEVIDSVTYGDGEDGWPSEVPGASFQLSTVGYNTTFNDAPLYWCVSTEAFGPEGEPQYGTPGAMNGDCR